MVWPHSVKPQTLCHLLFSGTDTSLCLHLHANHVNWTGWGVECFLCQKCSFISVLCGNQTLWYYYSPVLFLQITSSFSNILDRSNNVILRLKQWPEGSWGICAVGRRGAVSRSCWCSLRILFFFFCFTCSYLPIGVPLSEGAPQTHTTISLWLWWFVSVWNANVNLSPGEKKKKKNPTLAHKPHP